MEKQAIAEKMALIPEDLKPVVLEIAGLAFRAGIRDHERLVREAQETLKESFHGVSGK